MSINVTTERAADLLAKKKALLRSMMREENPARPAGEETIQPGRGGDLVPLSFSQQRLWLFDQMHPRNAAYNVAQAWNLQGAVNVAALNLSIAKIIERHQVLRSSFHEIGEEPMQQAESVHDFCLDEINLRELPEPGRREHAGSIMVKESLQPFDLGTAPLLRAKLIWVASQEAFLIITIPHIAFDAWSSRIFNGELALFYKAYSSSQVPVVRERPLQYSDFALWQRKHQEAPRYKAQLAYWKEKLQEPLPLIQWATGKAAVANESFQGAVERFVIPPSIRAGLRPVCTQERSTSFVALLAAFKALLFRHTGLADLLVATPVAGRDRSETAEMIGFFVNTLVVRSGTSQGMTFRELLRQVRDTTLEALEHQEIPFDRVVQEVQPHRNSGRNPLLQVMFSFQNSGVQPLVLAGLKTEPVPVDNGTAKFDLFLEVREVGESYRCAFEYNSDLFEADFIRDLAAHFLVLLEGIGQNPETPLTQLPLLSQKEEEELVVGWNRTEKPLPKRLSIPELFSEQVAKTPLATAVNHNGDKLSYLLLDQRSSALGSLLQKLGVGEGSLVGVCLDRSVEWIVSLLAILKAGGAYVPLDTNYPRERIAFMVQDSGVKVVLGTGLPLANPAFAGLTCVDLLQVVSPEKKPELEPAPQALTGRSLAYVLYTSGSTGKPKGVLVTHQAIARLVLNTDYIDIDPTDVLAQISNSSFDAATFEIWGALLNGARLEIMDRDLSLAPHRFASFLQEQNVSILFVTTALFNQLAAAVPGCFGGMKAVLFGGESADPKAARMVLSQAPPHHLLNVYGPTETTTFATWYEVKTVAEGTKSLPIGRPIANTQCYVLDNQLRPVPVGVAGELFIGGIGLAQGYLQRPDLTREKFVPSPFSTVAEERLYRTGDLVRWLPDGNIEFMGRMDNQVKIRGFRIELEEVEGDIKKHPQVQDAVVLAREDAAGCKYLLAFVQTRSCQVLHESDLKKNLRLTMPDFMVPAFVTFLNAFPLTDNGKVDKKALALQPLANNTTTIDMRQMPQGPLETELQKIWQSVLGRSFVGVKENFFELGGHSLLAVRLFSQIEKALGKRLSVQTLFQSPTIEELASVIREGGWIPAGSTIVEIQPQGNKPPIFWLHTLGGGGGGGLFTYRKLALLLGRDQPSYGIVAPHEPFCTIQEMARQYIEAMRSIQPKGPYHLGGYCFGGIIAYEMAQQLHQKGEKVAFLALLDSVPANIKHLRGAMDIDYMMDVVGHLPHWVHDLFSQRPDELMAKIKRKTNKVKKKVRSMLDLSAERATLTAPTEGQALHEVIDMSQYPKDYKRFAEVHWNALLQYLPLVYSGGPLTLYLSTASKAPLHRPDGVWKKLTQGNLEVISVPGTHEQMLHEPWVEVLAEKITRQLALSTQPAPGPLLTGSTRSV